MRPRVPQRWFRPALEFLERRLAMAPLNLAVLGDYGAASSALNYFSVLQGRPDAEGSVARLVNSWGNDFVLTTGDNNYFAGEALDPALVSYITLSLQYGTLSPGEASYLLERYTTTPYSGALNVCGDTREGSDRLDLPAGFDKSSRNSRSARPSSAPASPGRRHRRARSRPAGGGEGLRRPHGQVVVALPAVRPGDPKRAEPRGRRRERRRHRRDPRRPERRGAGGAGVHAGGRPVAGFAPLFPYGRAFVGGVRIAAGDTDGDGRDEVITSPGRGPASVKVFAAGVSVLAVDAYCPRWRFGAFVAAAATRI